MFVSLFLLWLILFPKKIKLNSVNEVILYTNMREEKKVLLDNEEEILLLQKIFGKPAYYDSPSCGFTNELYITMSMENKSLSFYPALDGCQVIYVEEYDKYIIISSEERDKLNLLFNKYGLPAGWMDF